jgi:hypothetical protein
MRHVLFASLLAVPSIALAQSPDGSAPPPPPPPGPPAVPAMVQPPSPEMPPGNGPPDGWQFQARMPTGLGLDTIISPGFSIGHRSGGMVLGADVGLTGGKFSTDNGAGNTDTTSVLLFSVMPMIYADIWKSPDGRARMNFVGGIGYGRGSVTTDSNDGMGNTTHNEATVAFMPLLAGIGGDYYLSPNFALGMEFSGEVPVLLSVKSNGTDEHVGGNLEALHGMLRATFVVGP